MQQKTRQISLKSQRVADDFFAYKKFRTIHKTHHLHNSLLDGNFEHKFRISYPKDALTGAGIDNSSSMADLGSSEIDFCDFTSLLDDRFF